VSAWPLHEQQWQVLHRLAPPLGRTLTQPGTWFASFELGHDEQILGLGEDFGPLGKRGTSHRLWMEEAWTNSGPVRYKPVPFLWSTAGWGVLVHTTNAVGVHIGSLDHSAWTVLVDDTDRLDLVFITGTSPERHGYRRGGRSAHGRAGSATARRTRCWGSPRRCAIDGFPPT
jgi:alpha-D-xyloside xylohydrolase